MNLIILEMNVNTHTVDADDLIKKKCADCGDVFSLIGFFGSDGEYHDTCNICSNPYFKQIWEETVARENKKLQPNKNDKGVGDKSFQSNLKRAFCRPK
jgi:hypothetical protein